MTRIPGESPSVEVENKKYTEVSGTDGFAIVNALIDGKSIKCVMDKEEADEHNDYRAYYFEIDGTIKGEDVTGVKELKDATWFKRYYDVAKKVQRILDAYEKRAKKDEERFKKHGPHSETRKEAYLTLEESYGGRENLIKSLLVANHAEFELDGAISAEEGRKPWKTT